MAQCHVYRNASSQTRGRIPYLLDVQADLHEDLHTRVVVPLILHQHLKIDWARLHPQFKIENRRVVMATADLASVPGSLLGEEVLDLSPERAVILAALDLLFTGV